MHRLEAPRGRRCQQRAERPAFEPRRDRLVARLGLVVGEPLPPTVELRTVPQHAEYNYAVVNDRRVIVEPRTRRVVRIID